MSSCYAEPSPSFKPAMRLIYSITKGFTTTVTTTHSIEIDAGIVTSIPATHDYISGLIVRIKIPESCGMDQLNGYLGEITVTGLNTFTIDVDSRDFQDFVIPSIPFPAWVDTCSQVIPVGERNDMFSEATYNTLI